jgi:hypothetical protein
MSRLFSTFPTKPILVCMEKQFNNTMERVTYKFIKFTTCLIQTIMQNITFLL